MSAVDRGEKRLQRARDLGADLAVDVDHPDGLVSALSEGPPADVIIDLLWGAALGDTLHLIEDLA